jgi:hypothetical protein
MESININSDNSSSDSSSESKKKTPQTNKERYEKFKKHRTPFYCEVCNKEFDYFSKRNHNKTKSHRLKEFEINHQIQSP